MPQIFSDLITFGTTCSSGIWNLDKSNISANQSVSPSKPARPPDASGIVFDIMRYCVHDGPGIRTAVFLKGCPLHCSWCHNPEGQSNGIELSFREDRCVRCGDCFDLCPNGAVVKEGDRYRPARETCMVCGTCVDSCYAEARELVGREMSVGEVMNEILKDLAFFDQSGGGVTFTGGEPLLQIEFVDALLRASKRHGIHTAVETSGFCNWATLERISAATDLFLYDIKIMDDEAHRRFTGVGNGQILDNLARLSLSGNDVVVRMPVLPGINDHEANLRAILEFLTKRTSVQDIHLLPFHRIGKDKSTRLGHQSTMPDLPVPEAEQLNAISTLFKQGGLRAMIGG